MRNLKLTVQYDGTGYVGWQRQPSGTSIQGLLEDALLPMEGTAVTVYGAGRTDAGVHALGQVASVTLGASQDLATIQRALNAVLPPAVRIVAIEDAAADFHARLSATAKTYEYRIVNAPFVSPFLHRYAWHVPQPLDVAAMRRAAALLAGSHDFAAFQGAGSAVANTERTIEEIVLEQEIVLEGDTAFDRPLALRIRGDGFLRHMMRTIAGTLVEVGLGRWEPPRMEAILAARDRTKAGPSAPAAGLFLLRVHYPRR